MGKWTRRGFIAAGTVAGGALVVGVIIRPGNRTPELAPFVTGEGETLVNTFVKVGTDGTVTAIVPHSEMGQGVGTALAQMLADEMDADWEQVRIMEAPAVSEYANYALGKGFLLGDADIPEILLPSLDGAFIALTSVMNLQITGGSSSVRATGVHGMRVAGAAARQMLKEVAAERWDVNVDSLTTESGTVLHGASGRRADYAELATAAGALEPPVKPALKRPEEFTIMGQPKARLDIPEKVDGSAMFGIDAKVPGMKYAAIRACSTWSIWVTPSRWWRKGTGRRSRRWRRSR
jgi:isoquinoline 1-oxidoreductase beta subunit